MIGIIGYGRFGRLMAGYLAEDYAVAVSSRSHQGEDNKHPNMTFTSLEEACRQKVVIYSVPISALQAVLRQTAPLLAPGTVAVDVSSVKIHPARWMEAILPGTVSILATHPMFGPDSAARSLKDRKIVLCPVRIEPDGFGRIRAYLESKGLIVIETTPEEHDRQIAVSLALTHFIGRSLSAFGADDLVIDTEGYKRLRHILGVVENDTWQLFEDMHAYNPYAEKARDGFMGAMKVIDDKLQGQKAGPAIAVAE